MRGDIVFRVYGVHSGRADDVYCGAFRSRADAEAEVASLAAKEMDGRNWAARYHDQGFVIREHEVETDFELPSRPSPREEYAVELRPRPNAGAAWPSTLVEVFRRRDGQLTRVCGFERNHAMYSTFEPFRQGDRQLALISRDYTRSAVLDLSSGEVIAEEDEETPGGGFCPVGFYVPDWWDVNDASILPGSEYWDEDNEWPRGEFGFVWGCYWGDDISWKVQHLDLSRVQEGVIVRDERFGYVALATGDYESPCFSSDRTARHSRPPFIDVRRREGCTTVRFDVEQKFELETGRARAPRLD